jgi:hypothetical protein
VADTRWETRLAKELQKVADDVVAREGTKAAQRVMGRFDVGQTKEYVAAATLAKAEEIVQALRGRLADEDASDVFNEVRENDAPRAATTMAATYAGFAVKEAAEQNSATVTWLVTSSNSSHPEMNGETIRAGETFSNGQFGPPADHPGCQCMLEIGSEKSAEPKNEALEVLTKTVERLETSQERREEGFLGLLKAIAEQNHTVNVSPAETHIHENAFPIQNYVTTPDLKVEKGAIEVKTNVETPTIHVPPTEVVIEKGAVEATEVKVEIDPPDVEVNVDARPKNRTVTFEDGSQAKVEGGTVTFSDGSQAHITEEED